MFLNQKSNLSQEAKIETLIGVSTMITGDINSSGVIKFDGTLTGNITSDSDIIIGDSAHINGNISGNNVCVIGKVVGNVNCSQILEILSSGNLTGDVEVANLSIEKGGIFNGRCNIIAVELKELSAPSEN